jgi:transcriptional regulator with XRE-family HTH domain
MDLFRSKIAQGLKKLRLEHEYSQEYLAEKLGKADPSGYQRIESGRTELKFEDAYLLAKIYQVPLEQIYDPNLRPAEVLSDNPIQYGKSNQLQVSVILDGKEHTLKKHIEMLSNVNKLLSN